MLGLAAIWGALLIALVFLVVSRPGRFGPLTLAYFLGLSLIHVPGVLPILASDSVLPDRDETQRGFEMTTLAVAAFVAGVVLAVQMRWRQSRGNRSVERPPQILAHFGWQLFLAGVAVYFVFIPLSFRVPSLTSLISALTTLLVLGLWFVLYAATLMNDYRSTLAVVAILPLLPVATLVTSGYLAYGINWVLSITAFLFIVARRRTWFYLAAPLVVFLGLSLFVSYMGQRSGIREVVWERHAGIYDRLLQISSIVTDFQMLDLDSPTQVAAVDGRLNQNYLVGAAIMHHESGASEFAYGGTVPVWALIPRFVWPDKPAVGGGGEVVSQFTGIRFEPETSVGTGQVLEFYVNFGTVGVIIGFIALGFLLTRLDGGIMSALAAYDLRGLVLRAVPGLTLLQPGGNLLEILVACVAAIIVAYLLVSLRLFDLRREFVRQT